LILLSREAAGLAYHPRELTVSADPGKLIRQLFLFSHGTKMVHRKQKESGGIHSKEPSNIQPPFES
jgi:hypothetical protein